MCGEEKGLCEIKEEEEEEREKRDHGYYWENTFSLLFWGVVVVGIVVF